MIDCLNNNIIRSHLTIFNMLLYEKTIMARLLIDSGLQGPVQGPVQGGQYNKPVVEIVYFTAQTYTAL